MEDEGLGGGMDGEREVYTTGNSLVSLRTFNVGSTKTTWPVLLFASLWAT